MQPPDATPPDARLPDLDWSPIRPDTDLHGLARACTDSPVPGDMHAFGSAVAPIDIHELWNRPLVLTPVLDVSELPPNTISREPTHLFLFMNDRTPGAAPFHQRVVGPSRRGGARAVCYRGCA